MFCEVCGVTLDANAMFCDTCGHRVMGDESPAATFTPPVFEQPVAGAPPRTGPAFIEFRDVSKQYIMGEVTIDALDNASFDIEEGELCLIIGSSGAGKTTALNVLGGIDSVTGGKVKVEGREITALSNKQLIDYRRNQVGFVFQFYNLIPNLTALENVEIATQLSKHPLAPEHVLAQVGLKDRMDSFPAQLSGGEQQRVSIARALAKNPRLLLCDEPTGALDYETGKQILQLLQDTCRKTGTTVVIISHNMAFEPIANRVVRMRSGQVYDVTVNPSPMSVAELEW